MDLTEFVNAVRERYNSVYPHGDVGPNFEDKVTDYGAISYLNDALDVIQIWRNNGEEDGQAALRIMDNKYGGFLSPIKRSMAPQS